MYEERTIKFAVCYISPTGFRTETFTLLEYDTLEIFKIRIHNLFEIPPHKQKIDGWKSAPEDNQTILQACCDGNLINYLSVSELYTENLSANTFEAQDVSEIGAGRSCFHKIKSNIGTSGVRFTIETLASVIETSLLSDPTERKAILLYLHNSKDPFSRIFLRKINTENISQILTDSFTVLGWDVQEEKYHSALTVALTTSKLDHLSPFVETKTCCAVLLVNIRGVPKISSFLTEDCADISADDTIYSHLTNCQDYLKVERMLASRSDGSPQNNDITAEGFQKTMANMLGDRDYDRFMFNQHEQLKDKISYAFFGQPREETGYTDREKLVMEKIFGKILEHSNKFAEHQDEVEISFIYNVLEPTVKERQSRVKDNPDYRPDADISPVPVFVLRKCRGDSVEACRIFIDDLGRVYESWKGYIEDNKLPKSIMVLPKNGRYVEENDNVLLERHDAPACSPIKALLKGGDIASTVGGVGSGGVMLFAGITSLAFAPAVLIGAGVVGATAGVYGIARSAANLSDRIKHKEDVGLRNSEARAIYFNLLAGTFGFVGAGANIAVSQLVARGVNIGNGVGVVVNTIGVTNLGVSGASIINSSYDVFDQWYNQNQKPTLLSIMQLSSSILFFGNAVYNFRSFQTIVDEAQANFLQEYQESLRSNRHRKTFNNLMDETIRRNDGNQVRGRAAVIKTVRNIPNKDEVFAVLTRTKSLMTKNGIKFFASDGDITLNGQTINMGDFTSMNRQQASVFLSNLPQTDVNASRNSTAFRMIEDFSFTSGSLPNPQLFVNYVFKLIGVFGADVQGMLMQIVRDAMSKTISFFNDLLDEIFPNNTTHINILRMVMEYFGGKAADYLENFNRWRNTGRPEYYNPHYVELPIDQSARNVSIFEMVVKLWSNEEHDWTDLFKHIEAWVLKTVYDRRVDEDENEERNQHFTQSRPRVVCQKCGGHYFNVKS